MSPEGKKPSEPHEKVSKKEIFRYSSAPDVPPTTKMRVAIDLADVSPEELRKILHGHIDEIEKILEETRTDHKTGLIDSRGFLEKMKEVESQLRRTKREKGIITPAAVVAIDLDGFKEVNDVGGHAFGDRVLKWIAEEVKRVLRKEDVFARVGGDEFGLFLAGDDEQGAVTVAEKVKGVIETVVRQRIQDELPSYTGQLSASLGIMPLTGGEDLPIEEQIRRADYASYVVKAAGKRGIATYTEARQMDAAGTWHQQFIEGKPTER